MIGGWVHDIVFSPSGSKIGWVGHDSSISVVQGGEGAEVATCVSKNLPFMTCVWLSESTIVAGGNVLIYIFSCYECLPQTYLKISQTVTNYLYQKVFIEYPFCLPSFYLCFLLNSTEVKENIGNEMCETVFALLSVR